MSYEKWAKVSGISKAEPTSVPSISPADNEIEFKIKKPPTKKVNNSDIIISILNNNYKKYIYHE